MLIVVSAGLYPLVVLANVFVAPHLPLPLLGRVLVTTVLNVAIMTYVVMPQLTWLLRSWLPPARSPRVEERAGDCGTGVASTGRRAPEWSARRGS